MCVKLENILAEAKRANTSDVSEICKNVETIVRVFVLDVPFMLICSLVFMIFACLWDRQTLHGWIVMGMAGSFTLRCSAISVRDLAIHLDRWNIIVDAPAFCAFLGEPRGNILLHHTVILTMLKHICAQVCCITGPTSVPTAGPFCWPLTFGIGCKFNNFALVCAKATLYRGSFRISEGEPLTCRARQQRFNAVCFT